MAHQIERHGDLLGYGIAGALCVAADAYASSRQATEIHNAYLTERNRRIRAESENQSLRRQLASAKALLKHMTV